MSIWWFLYATRHIMCKVRSQCPGWAFPPAVNCSGPMTPSTCRVSQEELWIHILQAKFHYFQNDVTDMFCFQLQNCKRGSGGPSCIIKGSENQRKTKLGFAVAIFQSDVLKFLHNHRWILPQNLHWSPTLFHPHIQGTEITNQHVGPPLSLFFLSFAHWLSKQICRVLDHVSKQPDDSC